MPRLISLSLILALAIPAAATAAPPPGRDAWTHEALAAVWARPLVGQGDGRVVVGAEDGFAYAFEAGGRLLWAYKASDGFCGWPVQLGPGGLVAMANRNGKLYLLDRAGDLEQKVDLGGVAAGPPAVHRGRLFFVTAGGRVVAVERGAVAWVFPGPVKASSAWPAQDGRGGIFTGFDDGSVVALDREGKVRWKVKVKAAPAKKKDEAPAAPPPRAGKEPPPSPAGITGAMALAGRGKEAILVVANRGGEVIALSVVDGAERWRGRPGPAPGGVTRLGRGVVFGTTEGLILALDATGKIRWKQAADGPVASTPAVSGDHVILGTDRGTLYILGRGGQPVALHGTGGPIRGAATVARGRVVFGSADRRVHVLPLPSRARSRWQVAAGLKARLARTPQGRILWRKDLAGPVARGVSAGRGGKILAATHGRKIYLLERDGRVTWSYNCGEDVDTLPVMGRAGQVAFGCGDGGFYGLRPDGEMAYRFPVNKGLSSSPTLARDGTAYFGARDRRIYALDAEGKLRWKVLTGDDVDSAPRIGPDGMIYVGSDDRHLYAVDPQGRISWYYRTGGAVRSRPAMAPDGSIRFTAFDQRLHAVDDRGAPRWTFHTSGQIASSPVVARDGTVYFGSRDHSVYAVDAKGKLRWRFGTADEVDATPALLGKGDQRQVAVGSDDGNLYVLDAATGALAWWVPAGAEIRGGVLARKDGSVVAGVMDGSVFAAAPPRPDGAGAPAAIPAGGASAARLGSARTGPVIEWSGGGFVTAGADGLVRAVGADGWPLWTVPVGRERLGAMVRVGQELFLPDNRGNFVGLSAGRIKFRLRLHKHALTDPLLLVPPGDGSAAPMVLLGSRAGRIWAISPAGKIRWFYSGSGSVTRPLLQIPGGVAAALGKEVVGVDLSGNEIWSHTLPLAAMAGPVKAAGGLALVDGRGELHILDAAGKPAWKRDLRAPAQALAFDPLTKSLLAGTLDGRLLELGPGGEPLLEVNLPEILTRLIPLPGGRCLVFTAAGGVLMVQRATGTWKRLRDLGGDLLDARLAADGRVLVSTTDGLVTRIDVK